MDQVNFTMTVPSYSGTVIEKKHFNKVALIDADRLKYLVASDVFKEIQLNYTRDEIDIISIIETRLLHIRNSFSAKGYIFCFSGKSYNTYRYHVAIEKEYKGNRKGSVDSTFYEGKYEDMEFVVKYIMRSNSTLLFPDLEADDILSMLQNDNTFICSNDKDLNQIYGHHFSYQSLDLHYISEEQALRNLCYQLLIGDSVDNIGGVPGCGPVSAKKIIDECPIKALPSKILYIYQTKFGIMKGTDAFVEHWNLVKLRTNRGTYFKHKYRDAFELLNLLLNQNG